MPLGPYRGIAYKVFEIEERISVNEHHRATNESSDGPRPPRGAAGSGRLFPPARLK